MNIQAEFLYITFEIIGPPYCKLRKRKNIMIPEIKTDKTAKIS